VKVWLSSAVTRADAGTPTSVPPPAAANKAVAAIVALSMVILFSEWRDEWRVKQYSDVYSPILLSARRVLGKGR
jgi:hypothetical protein